MDPKYLLHAALHAREPNSHVLTNYMSRALDSRDARVVVDEDREPGLMYLRYVNNRKIVRGDVPPSDFSIPDTAFSLSVAVHPDDVSDFLFSLALIAESRQAERANRWGSHV